MIFSQIIIAESCTIKSSVLNISPASTVQEFRHRRTFDAETLSNSDLRFQVFAFVIGCQAWLQTYHAKF
jgi:hypothetical protein